MTRRISNPPPRSGTCTPGRAVTSRTVRRLVASGALPVHRFPGRIVRISDADIEAFLAANRSF
jgi:excisionase family DNA binding protein